jgi:hypothetical protein
MRAVKVLSITLVVILGFSTFNASAESTTADVAACINKNTGTVRIAVACSPRETPFQWIINGLTGKSGPRGAQILTGKDAQELTTKNIGEIGDFYISTIDSTLYGPKSDKGWPKTGVKLQGAAGSNGAAGATGPAGSNGAAGATGPAGSNGTSYVATTYAIGATGPAGGIILMTPSSAGNGTGKYFEIAPADLSAAMAWCSDLSTILSNTGTAIGTGALNTSIMLNTCTSGAAFRASAYRYGTSSIYSDWFLPSKDELNQLCKYARQQTYSAPTTVCDNTGVLRSGFATGDYRSSSEIGAINAWNQNFGNGTQKEDNDSNKAYHNYVRPVRAFSP